VKSLLDVQIEFSALTPRLYDHISWLGYGWTYGDAYRDPRAFGNAGESKAYGHSCSAHKQRLAVDINLFRGGTYLESTVYHAEIGAWWEQQHELARWGGRWGDGNHYSFEWLGRR